MLIMLLETRDFKVSCDIKKSISVEKNDADSNSKQSSDNSGSDTSDSDTVGPVVRKELTEKDKATITVSKFKPIGSTAAEDDTEVGPPVPSSVLKPKAGSSWDAGVDIGPPLPSNRMQDKNEGDKEDDEDETDEEDDEDVCQYWKY